MHELETCLDCSAILRTTQYTNVQRGSRDTIASFMKGVSGKHSSLHRKSEVFGFAIHIPPGVNTAPEQQVGAIGSLMVSASAGAV